MGFGLLFGFLTHQYSIETSSSECISEKKVVYLDLIDRLFSCVKYGWMGHNFDRLFSTK